MSSEKGGLKRKYADPLTNALKFQARGKHSPDFQKPLNLDPIPEYNRAYVRDQVKPTGRQRKAIQ